MSVLRDLSFLNCKTDSEVIEDLLIENAFPYVLLPKSVLEQHVVNFSEVHASGLDLWREWKRDAGILKERMRLQIPNVVELANMWETLYRNRIFPYMLGEHTSTPIPFQTIVSAPRNGCSFMYSSYEQPLKRPDPFVVAAGDGSLFDLHTTSSVDVYATIRTYRGIQGEGLPSNVEVHLCDQFWRTTQGWSIASYDGMIPAQKHFADMSTRDLVFRICDTMNAPQRF